MSVEAARILILGAGSFARSLAMALGARPARNNAALQVRILSRDLERATWTALLAESRASVSGAHTTFEAGGVDWDSEGLVDEVGSFAPDVVVLMASWQSAWSLTETNAWTTLVREAGYAVTAALQGALFSKVAAAIAAASKPPRFVNGCYPDLLNGVAARRGMPIVCGLGNIATIATVARRALSAKTNQDLRMIAGHRDMPELMRPSELRELFPRCWLDGREVASDGLRLLPVLPKDASINAMNGWASAPVLQAVALREASAVFHAPGPGGRAGGYPVTLTDDDDIALALPDGIDEAEADEWNAARAKLDGAYLDAENWVRFSRQGGERLRAVAPELADGFAVADLDAAAAAFRDLRTRLSAVA